RIRLAIREPDFTTASRIENAINRDFGRPIARMLDGGTVEIAVTEAGLRSPAHLVSRIENIGIEPSRPARVVIDQRSGTIVLGADVRISAVAVTQGNLTLRIEEEPLVVQPNPFAEGDTIVVPRTRAGIEEDSDRRFAIVPTSVSLPEVVEGLNALGVRPRDMIDILAAIRAAGALHAELIVQ
ncbi:MAG: flagellar basal body P-ring protein FlgI, partial [Rubricella sp.]